MKCPFCHSKLSVWSHPWYTTYGCMAGKCVVDDMARYQISYKNYPTIIQSKTFMLDKYYVQIDYTQCKTTVSILEACFLLDSVEISRVLDVDFKSLDITLDKIRTLLIFS